MTYRLKDTYRVRSQAEAAAALEGIAEGRQKPTYSCELWQVDGTGEEIADLTPFLIFDTSSEIDYASKDEVPGKLTCTLSQALRWGSDTARVYQLIRQPDHPPPSGEWWAFPVGQYVLTTPQSALEQASKWPVTGYNRVYLLQSQPGDALTFAAGSTYLSAVRAVLRAAGVLSSTGGLLSICDYPAAWTTKTLPTAATYPLGVGKTHIQIINELLQASGCRPLYDSLLASRFVIELAPTSTATQSLRWSTWVGSSDTGFDVEANYPRRKILTRDPQNYKGDVYGLTNRWVAIQSNLTFKPVQGSGLDVYDNTTIPPSDQLTTGRVITEVLTLDASGQDDLHTQLRTAVAAALAEVEQMSLVTTPWPAAGHFDVFRYAHRNLPDTPSRRLQAQSWRLPLFGGAMQWETDVVVALT